MIGVDVFWRFQQGKPYVPNHHVHGDGNLLRKSHVWGGSFIITALEWTFPLHLC